MEKIIFIKYGELSTKKGNIKIFINKLYQNVLSKLKDDNVIITRNVARMYIELEQENEEIVIKKLQTIFGIHKIVIGYKINSNIEDINNLALNLLKHSNFNKFKVETKRTDKSFPYSSMDVSKMIGSSILNQIKDIKVDVHNPDIKLNIEIRKNDTYLYVDERAGLGGYPVGIQGKGLLMLSGGIDSPVAGYLSMKRGVKLECIYFESPPHTSNEAQNKVVKLAKILANYNNNNVELHIVPFTKIQEKIYQKMDPSYMITIMRRIMYRISEIVAKKNGSQILINGDSIGQVASQTLTSMSVINKVTNIPVIRPVACFDKLEIIDIAKKINTYDVSILPYEDCCTIFIPEHPVIHPSLEKCLKMESEIDFDSLINDSIENIKTIIISDLEATDFDQLL